MTLQEGREKFIQSWGVFGSKWGINRTMAQVHALLLLSPNSLSSDEIMEELGISRGNANMNLRALVDWGLIKKEHKVGQRKEYFYAEKDIWKAAKHIIIERKKRELEPIGLVLNELKEVEGEGDEVLEFKKMVNELSKFSDTTNSALDRLLEVEKTWILNSMLKILKAI